MYEKKIETNVFYDFLLYLCETHTDATPLPAVVPNACGEYAFRVP